MVDFMALTSHLILVLVCFISNIDGFLRSVHFLNGQRVKASRKISVPFYLPAALKTSSVGHGDYSKCTVIELKSLLRERGLPVSGVKAELIKRLSGSSSADNLDKHSKLDAVVSPRADFGSFESPNTSPAETASGRNNHVDEDDFLSQLMEEGGKLLVPGSEPVVETETQEPEISSRMEALIEARFQAKAGGDYDTADDIQLQLEREFNLEWKSAWKKRLDSARTSPKDSIHLSTNEIQDLVDERERYRSIRDFEKGDFIKKKLYVLYKVALYDKDGVWVCKDGREGPINSAPGPNFVENDDVVQSGTAETALIQQLIDMRSLARKKRDKPAADIIKLELRRYDVTIDDRSNVWRCADGREGPIRGGWGGSSGPKGAGEYKEWKYK